MKRVKYTYIVVFILLARGLAIAAGAEICQPPYAVLKPGYSPISDWIAKHRKLASLDKMQSIAIGKQTYQFQKQLSPDDGSSNSEVYLSADNKHVIKAFPKDRIGLAKYEYWVTRFYMEQEYAVPAVMHEPVLRTVNGVECVVLIKEYVEGIRESELWDYRRVHSEFNPDLKTAELINRQEDLGVHFRGGKNNAFSKWLRTKGVDPEKEFGDYSNYAERGDYVKHSNWIYTDGGWVLIDP